MLHVDMHTAQRRDPTAPQRQPARRPYFPIAHRPTSLSSTLSTRVKAKDYVQAIKLYKKGLGLLPDKKDPERVNFHKNLALCYIKLENYKDAIKQSSEVLAPPPPGLSDFIPTPQPRPCDYCYLSATQPIRSIRPRASHAW